MPTYPSLLPTPTGTEDEQTHLDYHNTIHSIVNGLPQRTLASTTAQHAADHNLIHPQLSGLTAGRTTATAAATHTADHARIHDLLRNLAAVSPDYSPTLYPTLGTTYDATITSGGTFATLQAFLTAQGVNKSLKVTGTYTAAVTALGGLSVPNGQKLYGEGSCILVGNTTCESGIILQGGGNDVTVDGMEIKDFKLRAVQTGDGTIVQNCYLHGNLRNGTGGSNPEGAIIQDNWIDQNGSVPELGDGAGGIKLASSGSRGAGPASIVRRNVVTTNTGNGIWSDVDSGNCLNTDEADHSTADNFTNGANSYPLWSPQPELYEDNIVYNNTRRGIFWEVSRGPVWIRQNYVINNNTSDTNNAAGIGVSGAKHALIEDNTCSGNLRFGIHVGSIVRAIKFSPDWPGSYTIEDITIRNNHMGGDLIFTDPDEVGINGVIGCGGLAGVTCSNNV